MSNFSRKGNRGFNKKQNLNQQFLPLGMVSQILYHGLNSYQHKMNNQYFSKVYKHLFDGGFSISSDFTLIKVESRNGFLIG